jgi:hypothetical protein
MSLIDVSNAVLNATKCCHLPSHGLSLQKANCVIVDPFDDSLVVVVMFSINPMSVVVRLFVDPMSIVSVRLLMSVHPHEDGQGDQSVALYVSARSQGKTFKKYIKDN